MKRSIKAVVNRNPRGFTIVELLIVIVVIGILATVAVVSYNGITRSANEVAVRAEMSSMAKTLEIGRAGSIGTGSYPASFTTAGLQYNRDHYATDVRNLFYFRGTSSSEPVYAIVAQSKSGKRFYVSSRQSSPKEYTGPWNSSSGDWAMYNYIDDELLGGIASSATIGHMINP